MPQAATVLDYASPRTHGRGRLPARSVLTYQRTPDGGIIVLETLTGKFAAISAIVFAAVSLGMFLAASIGVLNRSDTPWPLALAPFAFVSFGLCVMLAVINSTWRRTILRGTRAGIELSFLSPLRREKLMQWPPERVHSVMPVHTSEARASNEDARGELNLVIAHGPVVRLFTGHSHAEMAWIADCIRMVMGPAGVVE